MASAPASISPELVLVCPELAERARAALPDRPWEAFLPRLPSRPVASAAPAAPGQRSWPGRLASVFPAVLIAGFVAVVIVGSLPWLGERPTLGPAPPRVQHLPVVTTPTLPSPPAGATRLQRFSGTPSPT